MLGDGHAGGGAYNGGGGGNVERAQAVAAGADDVEDFPGARVSASSGGGMDLSRKARANAAISPGVSPFLRERGQKIGFDRRGNFFVGELFNRLADLLVRERMRGGKLLDEFFEHGTILRFLAAGSNRKVRLRQMKTWTVAENCVTCQALSLSQTVNSEANEILWQKITAVSWIKWTVIMVSGRRGDWSAAFGISSAATRRAGVSDSRR